MKKRLSTVESSIPPTTVVPTERRPSAARAGGKDQRQHAQDEGERSHQNRPQTQRARLGGGIDDGAAFSAELLGKLDDQNRVFAERPISITRPIWQ